MANRRVTATLRQSEKKPRTHTHTHTHTHTSLIDVSWLTKVGARWCDVTRGRGARERHLAGRRAACRLASPTGPRPPSPGHHQGTRKSTRPVDSASRLQGYSRRLLLLLLLLSLLLFFLLGASRFYQRAIGSMSDTMPAMPGILRIRDRIQSLDSSSRPDAEDSFFQGFQT